MKRVLGLAAFLGSMALPLAAQTAGQATPASSGASVEGNVEIGYQSSSLEGVPDFVSRYRPADVDRPVGLLNLAAHPDWGDLQLSLAAYHETDQDHFLRFDVERVLRSTTTYTRLLPRFGHDPLTNLEAVTAHGRVVRHTDTDPAARYDLKHGLLVHRTEIQPEAASALTLGFNFRDQRRGGARQATTISHCDNCHVVSQTQQVDEKLQDVGVDARFDWMKGFLRGEYRHRTLRQREPSVELLYDRALHPELRSPVFDNRIQFDALDGPLPVADLQDADKDLGRLKLQLSDAAGFSVHAGGVWSSTDNRFTGAQARYQGYDLSAARRFGKANLRLRARAYFLDNDDFFVDSVERANLAPPPTAGRTYRDIYGFESDFLRQSVANRDVYEANVDLSYRIGRRLGSVRALWKFKSVDRQHFEVAPGRTKTTTNELGVAWRPRPARGLRLRADYRHGFVDDPYMNVNGACSTLVSAGPLPNPFHPEAAQYYEFQSARIADTTADAGSWDDVRLRASYGKSKLNISGNYRYWNGSNTTGDLTDWSREQQSATVVLATMPEPRWDAFASWSWQRLELGSPACIPVFDG